MQQWLGGALTLTSGRFERRLKEERSKSGEYKVVQLAWNDARPLHYFSMLFHDLLLTYFPGRRRNGSTRLDRDAMEHAFESFAAGDLRVKLPVCDCHAVQPSSGLYVLFAELALLSAECGFDPLGAAGFWKQVANVLVRTQEIYCRRYMPTTSPKSNWDQTSYRACNFNACELPEHALRARIEDLRHSFRNADVRCLSIAAAQNADKYMPAQGR
jgi:hypothetical protein